MSQKRTRSRHKRRERQQMPLLVGLLGLLIVAALTFSSLRRGNPEPGSGDTGLARTAPEVGALAPDFELPDMDGEPVRISDFRGQPVALIFMHSW